VAPRAERWMRQVPVGCYFSSNRRGTCVKTNSVRAAPRTERRSWRISAISARLSHARASERSRGMAPACSPRIPGRASSITVRHRGRTTWARLSSRRRIVFGSRGGGGLFARFVRRVKCTGRHFAMCCSERSAYPTGLRRARSLGDSIPVGKGWRRGSAFRGARRPWLDGLQALSKGSC